MRGTVLESTAPMSQTTPKVCAVTRNTQSDLPPDTAAFLATFAKFMDSVNEHAARQSSTGSGPHLAPALRDHLGRDPLGLAVVSEAVQGMRSADADIAIATILGRVAGGRTIGIGGGEQRMHTSLSEMVEQDSRWHQYPLGAVDYVRAPVGPGESRRVVAFGLHLFRYAPDGAGPLEAVPVAILQRSANPRYGMQGSLEILAPDEDVASALLADLRATMNDRSVLRGQLVSFVAGEFDPTMGGVSFLERPTLTAHDVILPPGTLRRIERQVLGVVEHREALLAAGQHLKRGVLLYGPPGTGKTHTVRYLAAARPETTVIVLTGATLALVRMATEIARVLQPAIVVLEDCDLIAEDRSFHDGPQPLLFEVLDAMDGIHPDTDIAFLLTTNRADLLERALAQRPGRVDLAAEVPLPDEAARHALFELYRAGIEFSADALDDAAARTDGVTASFVKEVVRRAVLLAAEAGHAVGDADLSAAVTELTDDTAGITRTLLGGAPDPDEELDGDSDWVDGEGGSGSFGFVQ